MTEQFAAIGDLREGDIFSILFHIYRNSISGLLVITTENYEKQMVFEDRKVIFAQSDLISDSFGDYLQGNRLIDEPKYREILGYMSENSKRFGRSAIELGHLDYDQIWHMIPEHLKSIVYSFFTMTSGKYQVVEDYEKNVENIVLDIDIVDLILMGIREFKSEEFLRQRFASIKYLYVSNAKLLTRMSLKPYELHVFDLVKRDSKLEDIIKRSELLEVDTLKLLYLFLTLDIISVKRQATREIKSDAWIPPRNVVGSTTFTSFDEALRHYNLKYEFIYKTLCKEIGPIALSLLFKSIEDIIDNLPPYLQKAQLNSDGKLEVESILKALWYHDYEKHVGAFLRGLEEILYTEMYAVKRHLGTEYEQQVLKWINAAGK
ncbi:MAG: DUF4388 domain-containing protein [bacterium]|nr:DUF4388 domain-containing protein [bacterium]